ncbi:MAG: polyprenyl synthetase family protein [Oscillospiraceae bacterium]|jgi:geranylgeranyl diphosphate synthase type II|nr:polyprenyl synthetase family protein [Oscillospiraceae bacterium]
MEHEAQFAADAALVSRALLDTVPEDAGVVGEAMRYSLVNGGKRIRPVLTLAFCRLFGGTPEAALPLGLALELVHSYSLIHDDLPCMDDANLRRGKPACHKKFGEATALLAGDALLTQSFLIISQAALPAEVRCKAAALLAQAAGAQGMIGGQMEDIALERRAATAEELRGMNLKKTGALLRAACLSGCYAAGADAGGCAAAEEFSQAIGLHFQIMDDILDVTGDGRRLGKPVGGDEAKGKSTWVRALGLEGAKDCASDLVKRAKQALAACGGAEYLLWLTEYLAARTS